MEGDGGDCRWVDMPLPPWVRETTAVHAWGRGPRPPSTGSWHRCFPIPLPPCNGLCDLGSVIATHFPKPRCSRSSLHGSLSPGDPRPERRLLAPGPVSGDSGHLSGRLHPSPASKPSAKTLSGWPSEHPKSRSALIQVPYGLHCCPGSWLAPSPRPNLMI